VLTGFSASTYVTIYWQLRGEMVNIWGGEFIGGTSNAAGTTWTFTLPVVAGSLNYSGEIHVICAADNSAILNQPGRVGTTANNSSATVFKDLTGSATWTASGSKGAYISNFAYKID
jgi:hypothetical protein